MRVLVVIQYVRTFKAMEVYSILKPVSVINPWAPGAADIRFCCLPKNVVSPIEDYIAYN